MLAENCDCHKGANQNAKKQPKTASTLIKNSLLWKAYMDPKKNAGIFPFSVFPLQGGVALCKTSTIPITTNDKGAAYFSLNTGVIIGSIEFEHPTGGTASQFAPYRWANSNLPSACGFMSNSKNPSYDGSSQLLDNSSTTLNAAAPYNPTDEISPNIIGLSALSQKRDVCNAYYHSFLTRLTVRETSSLTERQGTIDVGISLSFVSDVQGSPYNYNKLKPDLRYSDYNTLRDLTNSKSFEMGSKISVTLLPPDNESFNLKSSRNDENNAVQRVHFIFHGCQPNTAIVNIDIIQPFIIIPNKDLADLGLAQSDNVQSVPVSEYTEFINYLVSNDLLIRSEGVNVWGQVQPDITI